VVEAADAGAGPLDHLGDAGVGEAAAGEDLPGGIQERALRTGGAPPLPAAAGRPASQLLVHRSPIRSARGSRGRACPDTAAAAAGSALWAPARPCKKRPIPATRISLRFRRWPRSGYCGTDKNRQIVTVAFPTHQ